MIDTLITNNIIGINKINHDNKIQVEINGDLFNCSIIEEPLYDPTGQKMRG